MVLFGNTFSEFVNIATGNKNLLLGNGGSGKKTFAEKVFNTMSNWLWYILLISD